MSEISTLSVFCAFCSDLFQNDHPVLRSSDASVSFNTGELHQYPEEFQEALETKCCLCILKWNQLSHIEEAQVSENLHRIDLAITVDLKEDVGHIRVMFAYRLEEGGRGARSIIKTIVLIPDTDMNHPPNPNSIVGSTESGETMRTIDWWLERCDRQHHACQFKPHTAGFTGPHRLPTRLLDLGNNNSTTFQLCLGCDLSEKTEYVTLSHCWGKFEPLRLTSENIASMKDGVHSGTLPKTFRDAISVTRQLGFRYLWIDSLCIMQDSKDDWEREALRMKDVYQQSALNIAASSAVDGRGGLFNERDPVLVAPHTVDITWENFEGRYHLADENLWKCEVNDSPLGSRGWVLQERLLSTRKVYFGKNQVFWECQESQASEAYPHALPSLMISVPSVWLNLNMWYDGVRESSWGSGGGIGPFRLSSYVLWDRIVQAYSALGFTYHTDRLVALSGMAKVVASMNQDRYLAGIWHQRLPRALLWCVDNPEIARYSDAYIAPSWSWVSVVGGVTCPAEIPPENSANLIDAIAIDEADTLKASTDGFGNVVSGFIKLRGALGRVTVGSDGTVLHLDGNEDGITVGTCADIGRLEEIRQQERGVWFHCVRISNLML